MKTIRTVLLLLTIALPAVLAPARLAAEAPYRLLSTIPVGGEGGWDYLTVDAAARRLYVSHATRVVVISLDNDQVVGEIGDLPGIHGIALAPDLGLGFTSNGREGKAAIVDLATLKPIGSATTGENPDAILYVPSLHEVYAFNGRGHSATVFEARTGKVVTTLPLPGKPEFAVLDAEAHRIYDNIEDASEIVAIDVDQRKVVSRWPLAPGEEPTGLAFDPEHHHLFAVCSNEKLVMLDSRSGKVLATLPIGRGVDGCAFDPVTGLIFASSGVGTVTIAREGAPGTLVPVQTLTTAPSARTIALDPKTHRIYLSAADVLPAPQESGAGPGRRSYAPNSFRVLVFGQD
jgi:DNA-binding beta-propeller fold protein YncE